MLKKDDFVKLLGESADVIAKKLKEVGKGNMGAAPLKIYEQGYLNGGLTFLIIGLGTGVFVAPKIKLGLQTIKQKINDSKRIQTIINDNEKDNDENQENDMEEQL